MFIKAKLSMLPSSLMRAAPLVSEKLARPENVEIHKFMFIGTISNMTIQ